MTFTGVSLHQAVTGAPGSVQTDNDNRAERRARAAITRYCVRNGLHRLWTLTCRDQTQDVSALQLRVRKFLRRMRKLYGALPYVVVLERHASGALHVHVALPKRFLAVGTVAAMWGHGFVYYSDRRRPLVAESRRMLARSAASYLAKYVGKDPVRLDFGHRYEVAEGFQARAVRRRVGSLAEGIEALWEEFVVVRGERPDLIWDSSQSEDWRGPPVRYMRFEAA